jgi:ADP-heptose:LPS heptosyltransferase
MKNVQFFSVDIRRKYDGLRGIFKLFFKFRKEKFDFAVDLQGNFYTKLLTFLLSLSGVKISTINNQIAETKQLTRLKNKKLHPLKSIFERHAVAFEKIGLPTDKKFISIPPPKQELLNKIRSLYGKKTGVWLGIAPLSEACSKTLPFKTMKKVISHFDKKADTKIFLVGAGDMANELLSDWQAVFNNVFAVHTELKLDEELALMSMLDAVISMDSANMHLAALTNTPVVSVWGATHPFAGFLGWRQPLKNCIGADLECRPCTAHKHKNCRFGDYRCLKQISCTQIIETTENTLQEQK